jgi:superfamily II DNA/RNA helicase
MSVRPSARRLTQKLQNIIGRDCFRSLTTKFPRFQIRQYQVLAVEKLVRRLRSKVNSLFLLDPGLGKTLISQLCFLGITERSTNRTMKALVLVPSRLLRDQHFKAASWFLVDGNILNMDSSISRFPTKLRASFERARWIISTPKLLSNALRRDYGLRRLLKHVPLCVVDEFDAQAAEDVDAQGEPVGRFSKSGKALIEELRENKTTFLCMSATQRAASAPWIKMFKLDKVDLQSDLLQEYRAFARTTFVAVRDDKVIAADQMISLVVLDALRKIRHQLTGQFLTDPEIDPERLYRQASRVFAGTRRKIFFPSPLNMNVDVITYPQLRALIARFLQAYAERLALYEGRMDDVSLDTYMRKAKVNGSEKLVDVESVSEISYSTAPTANAKIPALVSILNRRRNQRCLVLTRNTDVNHFVAKILEQRGSVVRSMTGIMSDLDRRLSLAAFEEGTAKVLIVNRQMGGRGFDLPIARYAVFLSPKRSEETLWQEMLRIRSSRLDVKDVFILYFSDTKEEEKMLSVMACMVNNSQRYEVRTTKA